MKVYCVSLVEQKKLLCAEYELSSFGFFEKKSVQEFMAFFSSLVGERTKPGQRQSIEQDSYIGYCYAHPKGCSSVLIADKEYPMRVAFSVINKIIEEFTTSVPKPWTNPVFPQLKNYLVQYQNPSSTDPIMKVQQELDETKVIMHKTIEAVLERGEQLNSLVERSDNLSAQSKLFYQGARKTNSSCCRLM